MNRNWKTIFIVTILFVPITLAAADSGKLSGTAENSLEGEALKGSLSPTANEEVVADQQDISPHWHVIAGGGGTSSVGTLRLGATIGQPVTGWQSVGTNAVHVGFWQNFERISCCVYRGNVDGEIQGDHPINIADLTFMVDMLFRDGPDADCMEEADVNADGSINISDLVYMIDVVFRGGPEPPPCP